MNREIVGENGGREEFLRAIYRAMWDNINRHIGVIWSSVTVLVGAFAVLGLVEKDVLPVDVAIALLILVAMWQLAHVYDASYWVNRNLFILRNVERQFLSKKDLKEIHYYFGEERGNKLIEHFQIQFGLGLMVPALMLIYHVIKRGVPIACRLDELSKLLPYLVLAVGIVLVWLLRWRHQVSYRKLIDRSPGAVLRGDG